MMSALFVLCLIFTSSKVQVICHTEEEKTPVQNIYMDVGNAVSSDNDNYMVFKDRNRENYFDRYFNGNVVENRQNMGVIYETQNHIALSGCKVRQNIFYCRQQSDDEEAPLGYVLF